MYFGDSVKTSLEFDNELWKKFRVKCLQEGKSASEVLRELVERYLTGGL